MKLTKRKDIGRKQGGKNKDTIRTQKERGQKTKGKKKQGGEKKTHHGMSLAQDGLGVNPSPERVEVLDRQLTAQAVGYHGAQGAVEP